MGRKKKRINTRQIQSMQDKAGHNVRAAVSAPETEDVTPAEGTPVTGGSVAAAAERLTDARPADDTAAVAASPEYSDNAAGVSAPAAGTASEPVSSGTAAVAADSALTMSAEQSFTEYDNNSLEDPELHILPFDRGGVESKRVQDPRLKPHGMPRHKPKAWRDLPVAGKIYKVFYFVCLCVFCVAIGMLLARGVAYVRHKAESNKISNLYVRDNGHGGIHVGESTPVPLTTMEPTAAPDATATPDAGTVTATDDAPTATPDAGPTNTPIPLSTPAPKTKPSFSHLLGINRDVVGFIELPGTVIRYPVLQSHDAAQPDYYLDHDIYRQHNYYGSIFMSYGCNSVNLAQNTVLSGHNMQDGEMFRQISNYTAAYMWKQNPYVLFDTLYESYEWEIFASYTVNAATETVPITFATIQEFVDYCNACKQRSVVKLADDVRFSGMDRILTLITCSYNGNYVNERTFAVFRLVWRSGEMDQSGSWKPTTPSVSRNWGW